MDYGGAAERTTEQILRIFRIPPTVFGIKRGGALGSDGADVDWLMYYEQCIKPRTERIERMLNEFLCPQFGPRVVAEFDFTGILPYQEVFLTQVKAYSEATGAPILTVEEARMRMGLPAEPQDGELLVPYTLSPASEVPQQLPAADAAPGGPDKADGTSDPAQQESRNRMRKLANRDLQRHERMFRRGLAPYFQRQEQRVVERLREQGVRDFQRVIDLDQLLEDAEGDRELIRNLIRAIVDERGAEVVEELAPEVAFSVFNERADQFIRNKAARMVTMVNNTTRAKLRDALGDGLANDEGLNELVARVREVYGDRRIGGAAVIARTETAAAYNFATNEGYEVSGIDGKEWLSAHDDAVRDAHAEADGQVVTVDDTFTLTDDNGQVWEAEYPGAPSLPPDLAANCRCTMLPVINARSRKRKRRQSVEELLNGRPHVNGNGKVRVKNGVTLEELLK
jgi:SPP1 gp7 family putative phage head morphogenesis protein